MDLQNHENTEIHFNKCESLSSSSSVQEINSEGKNTVDIKNSLNQDGESEVYTLLELCRKVHQQRLTDVDNKNHVDLNSKNEEKIFILQSYLQQLEEQNDVLTSTLIELEKEAEKRVKQMEKRLKTSAKTTMEAVINIHDCEKEMRRLLEERLSMETLVNSMREHLSSLKIENNFLRDQNCNLNHDVQALLHVIQHARSTGHWEMNCVTFCEVSPEQIFGPVQSISHLYSNESPQSDVPLQGSEQKEINSNFSSQDISHSSRSSSSISHQLELSEDPVTKIQFSSDDISNRVKIAEKDKKIAFLESHISELQHQLTVKEAECECHLWKLEVLMQHNQNTNQVFPSASMTTDNSMQKCISLPDIGNIYSYTRVLRRSHSCQASGYQANLPARPLKKNALKRKNICNRKRCNVSLDEKSASQLCKITNMKHPHRHHKAQSEPYLFMFGHNVYVYRPCEPIKKASNVALCNDYQLSLPPYQSIDLKFPVNESNLKICDWKLERESSIPHGIPENHYHKVDESSSLCSSNDSLDECSANSLLHQNTCPFSQPDCRNWYQKAEMYSSDDENKECSFNEKFVTLVSSAVQTENKIASQSIGLQADISENGELDLLNGNLFELDLSQLRRTVQTLKDSVLKAEDKAEAKSVLIEKLQEHITSAIKEVEMKDQALSNVEKKLDLSRNECSNLKENISSLKLEIQQNLKDMENLQMLNDNLELKIAAKEEKIKEMAEEQKMLQNQKRALMTQLDAQGDLFDSTRQELDRLKMKTEEYVLQIELQNQTIQNLQEALVKSKRASDNAFSKFALSSTNINSNLMNEGRYSSGSHSSVVDI